MDVVRLVWEHTFQLGHRSVALDEGIFKLSTLHGARNAPAPKQGRSRFTSPGAAARSQPLVQLACAGWDPGITGSSVHKNFWTQMPWLQSLVQIKGIFVSVCLLAQL